MKGDAIRVVKVGGSLLDLPDLPTRLDRWLETQTPACHVLVAGGGVLADDLRAMDQRFRLGTETAHWLAIDCMRVTARVLHAVMPGSQLVSDWAKLREAERDGPHRIVFDPADFLRHVEPQLTGCNLPHDWTVTSDSIAAQIALALDAHSLVLLKSCPPPTDGGPAMWARTGYVDEAFSTMASRLKRMQAVNLRDDAWTVAAAKRSS